MGYPAPDAQGVLTHSQARLDSTAEKGAHMEACTYPGVLQPSLAQVAPGCVDGREGVRGDPREAP